MERVYEDLKQLLHKELGTIVVKKNGLNVQDIEVVYKIVDILKDLCEIDEKESRGYSGDRGWNLTPFDFRQSNGYGGESYGGMYRGYSRNNGKQEMINRLYSMMGDVSTEAERNAIQDCIKRLDNA